MARSFLLILIALHGMIHLMGFAKAFHYGNFTQLTKDISKPVGLLWLLTAALFLASAVLLLQKKEWWLLGLAAIVFSQVLIFSVWQDAKFGSIANLILLVAVIFAFGAWRFEKSYQNDVQSSMTRSSSADTSRITEADIQHLPEPVQKYLRYVGVLNKPRWRNVTIVFEGEMRDRGKDWFPFRSEQYNFFDEPTRLFFMKGQMNGMTVPGYHAYKNGMATMQIKVFGLFPVVDNKGDIMNKAETVTVFNDMCLMAPASLIDKRIQWEPIDSVSSKATFTCNSISISAVLYFNETGQLTNFVSDDRSSMDMKQYRFSTPVRDYKNINGYNVMTYGEAIWHYPEGEFVYGKFHLKNITSNTP